MKDETKLLLTRWQSLERGGGLRRAILIARTFTIFGLLLCVFVVLSVAYQLHPIIIAIAAAATGWLIAETNALRTRLAQWPIFRTTLTGSA